MGESIRYACGMSFLGDFMLASSAKGIVALEFGSTRTALKDALLVRFLDVELEKDEEGLATAMHISGNLIDGLTANSDLPLDLRGTSLEVDVWDMLQEIPSGQTTTYGALAAKLGILDARVVSEAVAANPVALIVPCHRVIRKNGSISGYRWGVWRKRALLARELEDARRTA
ncbi:cysteine methyltransferase [Roseibium algicola]|uniref:Cysteine methyltransferase n=1 Tax=Roseibium algicola TaxID=2857014 RepID=A0ABM6I4P6_9HYPH|nr:methylated-DNA--[protein]-cysteine S-methyltransferase [Roseibium aggregatum]AQQ05364.1 cysteine methyltransferase [Roseibium aggregatum]